MTRQQIVDEINALYDKQVQNQDILQKMVNQIMEDRHTLAKLIDVITFTDGDI